MGIRMITDFISLQHHPLQNIREIIRIAAQYKEGRISPILFQSIQNCRRIALAGTIVKG